VYPVEASGIIKSMEKTRRVRGRPKLTLAEAVKGDLKDRNVPKVLALDRTALRSTIHVPESYFTLFFLLLLVLVSIYFCCVSYLSYPNLLGKKAFMLLFVGVVVSVRSSPCMHLLKPKLRVLGSYSNKGSNMSTRGGVGRGTSYCNK
jgi:hypothetical protein